MRYFYHCFAVVTSFVVQNNNQIENSLIETLTTMVSLSFRNTLEPSKELIRRTLIRKLSDIKRSMSMSGIAIILELGILLYNEIHSHGH